MSVAVAGAEFVDATGGIDEFLLSGVEGVRGGSDFEFDEGVCFAVEVDGFASGYGAACDEHFVVRHIFEHHFAIVGGMDVFFHFVNEEIKLLEG